MKLKIVQAVKLGTVACLLAVSCQTIAAQENDENLLLRESKSAGQHIRLGEDNEKNANGLQNKHDSYECLSSKSKRYKIVETGGTAQGEKRKLIRSGDCHTEKGKRQVPFFTIKHPQEHPDMD